MKKAVLGVLELCLHILVYALVIFLTYRAAVFAYHYSYNLFGDPVASEYDTETQTIVVEEGDTASDVAEKLKDAGIIEYETAFTLRVQMEEIGDDIMPGTFELSPSMSLEEILEILTTEGDVIQEESEEVTR